VLLTDLPVVDELNMTYGTQDHLRYLRAEDIDKICTENWYSELVKRELPEGILVRRTSHDELMNWQHKKADFLEMNIYKKSKVSRMLVQPGMNMVIPPMAVSWLGLF